jgi:hypothetical protein
MPQAVPGRLDDDHTATQLRPLHRERERGGAPGAPAQHVRGRTDVLNHRSQIGNVDPVVTHRAVHRAAEAAPVVGDDPVPAGSKVGDCADPQL